MRASRIVAPIDELDPLGAPFVALLAKEGVDHRAAISFHVVHPFFRDQRFEDDVLPLSVDVLEPSGGFTRGCTRLGESSPREPFVRSVLAPEIAQWDGKLKQHE
jgi:hypothetical protein